MEFDYQESQKDNQHYQKELQLENKNRLNKNTKIVKVVYKYNSDPEENKTTTYKPIKNIIVPNLKLKHNSQIVSTNNTDLVILHENKQVTLSTSDLPIVNLFNTDNTNIIKNDMKHRYSLIDTVLSVKKDIIQEIRYKAKYCADVDDMLIYHNIACEKNKKLKQEQRNFEKKEEKQVIQQLKDSIKNTMIYKLYILWYTNFVVVDSDVKIISDFFTRDFIIFCNTFKHQYNTYFDIPGHNDLIHDYVKGVSGLTVKQDKSQNNHTFIHGVTLQHLLDESSNTVQALTDKPTRTNTDRLIEKLQSEIKDKDNKIESLTKLVEKLCEKVEQQDKSNRETKDKLDSLIELLINSETTYNKLDKKKLDKESNEYKAKKNRYEYLVYKKKKHTANELLELEELKEYF